MRVALVYDRVNKWGGAERVLLALHELFPEAPLYTSVYNPETAPWAKVFPKVVTSFLQSFPFAKTRHDLYAPLMPMAFESFDFSGFDLVISVTSEAAKGIITRPETRHICYMLTPTRYLWSGYEEYFNSSLRQVLSKSIIRYLRSWDKSAASRPDVIISISKTVQDRVKNYYARDSKVIYPPVNTENFKTKVPQFKIVSRGLDYGKYFLIVSRLVPYKKVDLAIKVCNDLKLSLVIVGVGSEQSKLVGIAGPTITFAGQVQERDLLYYYQGCRALIFPQEEDFGIVALEAQASGRPVIAYGLGGAAETIIDQQTGILFKQQTEDGLKNALQQFQGLKIQEEDCIKNAERFTKQKFLRGFATLISNRKDGV
jgi:glycosyltransferase involved in cell wall biosynthesis